MWDTCQLTRHTVHSAVDYSTVLCSDVTIYHVAQRATVQSVHEERSNTTITVSSVYIRSYADA